MSDTLNFNLSQPQELRNVLYYNGNNGYRAIINGKIIGIQDMETVKGLEQILPSVSISAKDIKAFEKAVTIDGKCFDKEVNEEKDK